MESGDPSRQALTLARKFGDPRSVRMDAIQPFAPDALAATLALAADQLNVSAVFAAGTDPGHEGMGPPPARAGAAPAAHRPPGAPGPPGGGGGPRGGGGPPRGETPAPPRPPL